MTCNCGGNLPIIGNVEAGVPVCLPLDINVAQTEGGVITGISDFDYAQIINEYCNTVAGVINRLPPLFIDACGFTPQVACAPAKFDAGLTDFVLVQDPSCSPRCAMKRCVRFNATGGPDGGPIGNCRNSLVGGVLDLTRCDCNEVPQCTTGDRSATICRPMPGSDPPSETTWGLLPGALSAQSTLNVDPSTSSLSFTITVSDPDGGSSDTANVSTKLRGSLFVNGIPRDDGTSAVFFAVGAEAEDTSFTIAGKKVDLTHILTAGGADTTKIQLNSSGVGLVPATALAFFIDFTQNGQRSRVATVNSSGVPVKIDFSNKTFDVQSVPFTINEPFIKTWCSTGWARNSASP